MNLLSIVGAKIYIYVHFIFQYTCSLLTHALTCTHTHTVSVMQPDFSCVQGAFGSVQAREGDSKEVGVCRPLHHRAAV